MKAATERVEYLLELLQAEIPIINIVGLQFFVMEEEWKNLPHASQRALAPLVSAHTVRFMDLHKCSFTELLELRELHGWGISLESYFILKYCLKEQITLVSDDKTLIRVARLLKVKVKRPEALKLELLIVSGKHERPSQTPERIIITPRKKDMKT